MFLWAVNIFRAVAGSLDPNFRAYGPSVIRPNAALLKEKYDQIMKNGLTPLSPPNWAATGLVGTACPSPVEGVPPPPPKGIRLIYHSARPPVPVAAMIEYGAVERYSGCSSVGDNYTIAINSTVDNFDPAIFSKLQVRVLKHTKDVYILAGLLDVWQVINHLNSIVGDPLLPGPSFGDWSIREVAQVSHFDPNGSGFSLRSLGQFIIGTQPLARL
jgi:hypothetical protein